MLENVDWGEDARMSDLEDCCFGGCLIGRMSILRTYCFPPFPETLQRCLKASATVKNGFG
jgi:hypothetical protein